tara:strand:+ start:435 stop:788 length:354 start_codon:yes stop_codon:yes gene_type:complete
MFCHAVQRSEPQPDVQPDVLDEPNGDIDGNIDLLDNDSSDSDSSDWGDVPEAFQCTEAEIVVSSASETSIPSDMHLISGPGISASQLARGIAEGMIAAQQENPDLSLPLRPIRIIIS